MELLWLLMWPSLFVLVLVPFAGIAGLIWAPFAVGITYVTARRKCLRRAKFVAYSVLCSVSLLVPWLMMIWVMMADAKVSTVRTVAEMATVLAFVLALAPVVIVVFLANADSSFRQPRYIWLGVAIVVLWASSLIAVIIRSRRLDAALESKMLPIEYVLPFTLALISNATALAMSWGV